jgi:hypothetical protein
VRGIASVCSARRSSLSSDAGARRCGGRVDTRGRTAGIRVCPGDWFRSGYEQIADSMWHAMSASVSVEGSSAGAPRGMIVQDELSGGRDPWRFSRTALGGVPVNATRVSRVFGSVEAPRDAPESRGRSEGDDPSRQVYGITVRLYSCYGALGGHPGFENEGVRVVWSDQSMRIRSL